ncbi:UNVERIFIED_CONTAM: purine nucleosidase [Brevibacillus sp. OAP136]
MSERKRVILDVDTGIDDALAILYLLKSKEAHVEGIIAGFGNVDAELAAENTLKIVELADCGYEVPVLVGAKAPLVRAWKGPVTHIHGANGIGNVELPKPKQAVSEEHPSVFLSRLANTYPGEITLVTVGRMTNLANALAHDPSLKEKLKEVVVMGGAIRVPGNVTPVVEANMGGDPEAAYFVVESGIPLTLVSLDVTMKTRLTLAHLDVLERIAEPDRSQIVRTVRELLTFRLEAYAKSNGITDGSPLHDPLAVAVALDPTLVETERLHVAIECKGSVSAGATIADMRAVPRVGKVLTTCHSVDAERFIKRFVAVLAGRNEEEVTWNI